MNTALLASLEQAIDKWLQERAEQSELSTEVYWSDLLPVLMARAAAAAFDASENGQRFAHEQEPE